MCISISELGESIFKCYRMNSQGNGYLIYVNCNCVTETPNTSEWTNKRCPELYPMFFSFRRLADPVVQYPRQYWTRQLYATPPES